MRTNQARQSGFTLIEMLVVLGLILFISALTYAFMPSVQEKQRVARGASLLQGWLAVAKNMAIRDGAPRGVRLSNGALVNGQLPPVTALQYIEQPDDFFQGGQVSVTQRLVLGLPVPGTVIPGNPSSFVFDITAVPNGPIDFYGGFAQTNPALFPIQVGDYLEIGSPPQVFRVTGFPNPLTAPPGLSLVSEANNPPNSNVPNTGSYRFVRQPRVREGQASMDLPADVALDLTPNSIAQYANALPTNAFTGNIEILFSPAGAVIGPGSGNDKIQLWLRDTSVDAPPPPNNTFNGDVILVTVYVRSGLIAANPIDPTLLQPGDPGYNPTTPTYRDPYAFTRDGRASGL
jgi:prepilin-type N-terminal cleavage/methylation domain-containing protein